MSSVFGQNTGTSVFGQNQSQQNPLFGSINTSQPQQTGPLFGNSTNQQQTQNSGSGGGLFGASTNQQSQTTNSPFGGASNQNQNQQQGAGLFGNAGTQNKPPPLTLFGSNNPQPQQSGNLFGSLASSQPQQSSNVFGSSTAGAQPQQGGGLFGSSTAATQPQQTGGGLFGSTTNTGGQTGGGLFGSAFNSQSQQNKPLFSLNPPSNASANQPHQPQLFGNRPNLTMGQGNQPQTVPGVRIDVSNIRGTTRFNDLHDELQKQIEMVDEFIQKQIAFKEQCDAIMPSHAENLSSIPNDVEFVSGKVDTVELALDNDSAGINHMKSVVQKDADDAMMSFRVVDNLKLPQQFHYHGGHSTSSPSVKGSAAHTDPDSQSTDLVSYFSLAATEMTSTLDMYRKNVEEIEAHLRTVEASTVAQSQQLMFTKGRDGSTRSKEDQVRELAAVLREFEGGILGVASKVGQMREEVQQLVLRDSLRGRW